MPRRSTKTTEDIDSAASEAAKGAVVGAAKVGPKFQINIQSVSAYIINKALSVGPCNRLPRRRRLRSLANLPQSNYPVQSLHSNLRYDSRRHDRC